MRSLLLFVLLALSASMLAQTPCTPDTSLPLGYVTHSDSLACIVDGEVYHGVIQFSIPDSIVFGGSTVGVSRYRIDSINNLPCNISWAANQSSRIYNGGEYGCVALSGTPDDEACQYPLQLWVAMDLNGAGAFVGPLNTEMFGIDLTARLLSDNSQACMPVDTGDAGCTAQCIYTGPISLSTIQWQDAQVRTLDPGGLYQLSWAEQPNADKAYLINPLGQRINTYHIIGQALEVDIRQYPKGVYLLQIGEELIKLHRP